MAQFFIWNYLSIGCNNIWTWEDIRLHGIFERVWLQIVLAGKRRTQKRFLTCICLRRTLCARFSCERRTVTSSHPQPICLSCITWHWKKLLDEQWSHNLDYERWYLYRCSLYAPCGIFADYEFLFILQLSQTVAQYNSTTAFCNLWWHSCTVIFVGNNNKIH